jgi:hypothetical protein
MPSTRSCSVQFQSVTAMSVSPNNLSSSIQCQVWWNVNWILSERWRSRSNSYLSLLIELISQLWLSWGWYGHSFQGSPKFIKLQKREQSHTSKTWENLRRERSGSMFNRRRYLQASRDVGKLWKLKLIPPPSPPTTGDSRLDRQWQVLYGNW